MPLKKLRGIFYMFYLDDFCQSSNNLVIPRGTRDLHMKLTQSYFCKLSSYLRRSLVPRDDKNA